MHHQQSAPQHHQLEYQLHGHQIGLIDSQQVPVGSYNDHQWHHQQPTAESHMMGNQSYQLHTTNQSNFHHLSSPNQQMLLMQPPNSHQLPTLNQNQQQMQPQISPQLNTGGNNYIGQSPSQTVQSNENGSTSDDSDDNLLSDPNVSMEFDFVLKLISSIAYATHQTLIIDLWLRFSLHHAFN